MTLKAQTDRAADKIEDVAEAASNAGAAVAAAGTDVAELARRALADMKTIIDDFAARTGEQAGKAIDGVEAARVSGVQTLASMAEDARALGRDGIDSVGEAVGKRPVAALALAAVIGLAIGWATRPGGRS